MLAVHLPPTQAAQTALFVIISCYDSIQMQNLYIFSRPSENKNTFIP